MACCLIKYLYNFIFTFSFTLHVIYCICKQRSFLTSTGQLIPVEKLLICVWQVADSHLGRHTESTPGFSLYRERKSYFIWRSAVFVSSRFPFSILYLIPVVNMWFFPVPRNHNKHNTIGNLSLLFLPFLLYRVINPLKTKRRLLYLKTQFVPRSKHFSSRL